MSFRRAKASRDDRQLEGAGHRRLFEVFLGHPGRDQRASRRGGHGPGQLRVEVGDDGRDAHSRGKVQRSIGALVVEGHGDGKERAEGGRRGRGGVRAGECSPVPRTVSARRRIFATVPGGKPAERRRRRFRSRPPEGEVPWTLCDGAGPPPKPPDIGLKIPRIAWWGRSPQWLPPPPSHIRTTSACCRGLASSGGPSYPAPERDSSTWS